MASRAKTTNPSGAAVPSVYLDPAETADRKVDSLPIAPKREVPNDADEKARQAAFDAEYIWHGKALLPFSSSREALWLQLRAMAGAPSLGFALAEVDSFLADAQRILFLCSHEPEEIRMLRADPLSFQEAIDKWADENISRLEKTEATTLALRIYNQSYENQHEPAPPETSGHSDDSGN
jgi:hypothetical protein